MTVLWSFYETVICPRETLHSSSQLQKSNTPSTDTFSGFIYKSAFSFFYTIVTTVSNTNMFQKALSPSSQMTHLSSMQLHSLKKEGFRLKIGCIVKTITCSVASICLYWVGYWQWTLLWSVFFLWVPCSMFHFSWCCTSAVSKATGLAFCPLRQEVMRHTYGYTRKRHICKEFKYYPQTFHSYATPWFSLFICGVHSCRSDLGEHISHKSEDLSNDSIERYARDGRRNGAGISSTLYWVT